MTRKDYEVLAAAFATARPVEADFHSVAPDAVARVQTWLNCARVVGDACEADNPRFDRTRFVGACLKVRV